MKYKSQTHIEMKDEMIIKKRAARRKGESCQMLQTTRSEDENTVEKFISFEISINDSGNGISKDGLKKLF